MKRPLITLACGRYDRTEAITEEIVRVEGADINYIVLEPTETFWRMLKYQEFDVSEMSLSSFLIARDFGFPELVALPVFISRMFRHSYVYVNPKAGIVKPEDLKGKRMGVPEYQITAAVWVRGFLYHEYGVAPQDLSWWVLREEKYEIPLEGVEFHRVPPGKDLEGMVMAGEIDALIHTHIPKGLGKGVVRLFPDFRLVEEDYYRRTHIFPIMHIVVMRKDIYERYPWLARSLYKAFEEAKAYCEERMYRGGFLKCTLPWLVAEIESERAIMGNDLWPYGVEPNRATLEAFLSYSGEQGLIHHKYSLEDLFLPVQWTNPKR